MNKKTYAAIQQYIDKAGGAEKVGIALAQHMGRKKPYTRQAVENWYRHIKVPAEVAVPLESVIQMPRHLIRPDLWSHQSPQGQS